MKDANAQAEPPPTDSGVMEARRLASASAALQLCLCVWRLRQRTWEFSKLQQSRSIVTSPLLLTKWWLAALQMWLPIWPSLHNITWRILGEDRSNRSLLGRAMYTRLVLSNPHGLSRWILLMVPILSVHEKRLRQVNSCPAVTVPASQALRILPPTAPSQQVHCSQPETCSCHFLGTHLT
jgi:hypothetical protein